MICLFDADQCPNADFFLKTVPLLDGGQDVAMVLSPQVGWTGKREGEREGWWFVSERRWGGGCW